MNQNSNEGSVSLAYELIVPSYGWAMNRWDALHERVDRLLTFSTALIVAASVLARVIYGAEQTILDLFPLLVAVGLWLGQFVVGFYALKSGKLRLLNLRDLYKEEQWLNSSPTEFQRDLLGSASEDFANNIDDVNSKAALEKWIIVLLALEGGFIAMWLLG